MGQSWRFLNRDGSFNIDRSSYATEKWRDPYHVMLSASWWVLLVLIGVAYFAVNLAFGTAYYLAGPSALQGIQTATEAARFWDCFFFSVQTLATIGYGQISPVSLMAHILVTFEALTGLMGLALATGIVFSRFARPSARVRFSEQALITEVDGKKCLMFRMANARMNLVAEAQVRVTFARRETTREGISFRELYDLPLERDRSPLFAMSWTVVHFIDDSSPLKDATVETLRNSDCEVFVTVIGTDETFSQPVQARYSYTADEIEWDTQYEDIVLRAPDGRLRLALDKISVTRGSGRR